MLSKYTTIPTRKYTQAVVVGIVVYLEITCMMARLRPLTALNTNDSFKFNHTPIQTYFLLFVRAQATRHRYIHSTNKTHSRHRHCSVFGQFMRVRLRPHTSSNTNGSFKFKHIPIQTYGLFVRAQHDTVTYMQRR